MPIGAARLFQWLLETASCQQQLFDVETKYEEENVAYDDAASQGNSLDTKNLSVIEQLTDTTQ